VGAINLPTSGRVYLDTQSVIYIVEQHPTYFPILRPVWAAAQAGTVRIVTSEITILETLIGPYKSGDTVMAANYEQTLALPVVDLVPITPAILRDAARLRAAITRLRTPDAIHAATALAAAVTLFVTNDFDFRNVPGLPVDVLQDVLARP
jgi:predicted nucleic acid-binding protein